MYSICMFYPKMGERLNDRKTKRTSIFAQQFKEGKLKRYGVQPYSIKFDNKTFKQGKHYCNLVISQKNIKYIDSFQKKIIDILWICYVTQHVILS